MKLVVSLFCFVSVAAIQVVPVQEAVAQEVGASVSAAPYQAPSNQASPMVPVQPAVGPSTARVAVTPTGAQASSLSDLVFFPSKGQVYLMAHGLGMFNKIEEPASTAGKINTTSLGAGGQVMFALSDYIALGAKLGFIHTKMKMSSSRPVMDEPSEGDEENPEDGEADQSSTAASTVNVTQKQLSPSLLVSINPLGHRTVSPVDLRIDLGFTPEWLVYMPKSSLTASVGGQSIPIPNVNNAPAPDKMSNLSLQMQTAFKAHSMIQLALGVGYMKSFNFSKDKAARGEAASEEERALFGGSGDVGDSLDAGFMAQFSLQDKAFIAAGLNYNMQLNDGAKSTPSLREPEDEQEKGARVAQAQGSTTNNHKPKSLMACVGVRAMVHPQMTVQVGGGYQLWHSKPAGASPKYSGWKMTAGLQAVF